MGMFDITPIDVRGSQLFEQNRETQAQILGEQAQQQGIRTQEMRQQLASMMTMAKQRQDYQQALAQLPQKQAMGEQLEGMIGAAMRTGNFDQADKLLTLMSMNNNRESLKLQREANVAQKNAATAAKTQETVGRLYEGVTNADEWRQAHELYRAETGEDSPLASKPYSAGMVRMLKASQTRNMSPEQMGLQQQRLALMTAQLEERRRLDDIHEKLLDAQTRATEARRVRIEKATGNDARPSRGETQQAEDILVSTMKLSPAQAQREKSEIAALAKEYQRAHGGEFSAALDKVVNDNASRYKTEKNWMGKEKTTVEARALPLPASGKDLKAGTVYEKGGVKARYLGDNKWEKVND